MRNPAVIFAISALLVPVWGDDDNSIPPPRNVLIEDFDDGYALISFEAVEGATSYLILRQITVTYGLKDSEPTKLEEPELALVGEAHAIPGADILFVVIAFDGDRNVFGVQALGERDGTQLVSPIVFATWPDSPTAVVQKSWGQIKVSVH